MDVFNPKEEFNPAKTVWVQEEQPQEDRYPRTDLIANSNAIFGVMPEVVVGALHGNDAEELTIAEIQKAVKKFLTRRVV